MRYVRIRVSGPLVTGCNGMMRPAPGSLRARVERALDRIRPALQADGGDVHLVEVLPDGVVRIRLVGACRGCSLSSLALRGGVEECLRQQVPEVTSVETVRTPFLWE
jgi:Fe-S cluster biogenesis protein NfuA